MLRPQSSRPVSQHNQHTQPTPVYTAGQRLLAPAILAIMAFTTGCMTGLTTHQGGVSGDEGFDGVDSPEQDQETQDDETADTGDENTGGENTGDENTGDENTGDENTGDENTGDENTDTDDGAADGDQDPTTDQDDSPADLDDAALVYADFPLESECDGVRSAAVTMQNTGTTTWTRADGYKLGAVDDSDPFYGPDTRVWLPADAVVLPGDSWTFYIDMQAPSTPGLLTTDWQMVHEAVQWFGEEAVGEVDVTCADTTEPSGWTTLACARNGAEICDDELFTAPGPGDPQLGILCENGEGGIGFVSSNTGPAQSDGVTRCQGWEDQGLDAWDYLDYVDSIVCDQAGVVLPIDLSASPGGHFWFGAHDNPGGGGHMTNICLVEWTG